VVVLTSFWWWRRDFFPFPHTPGISVPPLQPTGSGGCGGEPGKKLPWSASPQAAGSRAGSQSHAALPFAAVGRFVLRMYSTRVRAG
jgi:hypothetical protein